VGVGGVVWHSNRGGWQVNDERKHTPEPWALRDYAVRSVEIHADGDKVKLDSYVIAGGHCYWQRTCDFVRIVACVNACAGIADPAKELERLRQIEKQWREDNTSSTRYGEAVRAAGLEVRGYTLKCPAGHEHDWLVFATEEEADEHAEDLNDEYPEGENPHEAVALYVISPLEIAQLRAELERRAKEASK